MDAYIRLGLTYLVVVWFLTALTGEYCFGSGILGTLLYVHLEK